MRSLLPAALGAIAGVAAVAPAYFVDRSDPFPRGVMLCVFHSQRAIERAIVIRSSGDPAWDRQVANDVIGMEQVGHPSWPWNRMYVLHPSVPGRCNGADACATDDGPPPWVDCNLLAATRAADASLTAPAARP